MSDDQSGVSEHQITFYRVAGHSHNGEDSSRIDFSTYDILDVIDMGQLQSIIVNTVQNSVLTTNSITVGGGGNSIVIDGSTPSTPGGLSVSSSASTVSDGNIYIDASWSGDDDGSNITYRVKLEKSDNGSAGTYYVSQTAETSELSHRFEWIDNASSDGSTIYYKVSIYAISPLGVISTPTTSSAIAPAVDSTAPARPVFNNTLTGFDEGVNPTFKGFFVQLADNSEFDVKDGRGQYEFQVSISNNPLNGAAEFDDANKMKASGSSKSNFFLINNLAVRASAGASKTDYYLRVRAKDSSGNTSPWTYYRNTSDGGSSGAGTTDLTLSSAINVLEVAGGVDIEANSITANDILAGTITATQIASNTITAANIAAGAITTTELNASVVEVGDTISSANYDNTSGSEAGWQLHSDGSGVLNNLTARGGIYATSGEIGSGASTWTIGSGTMQANTGASSLILSAAGTVPFIRMGSKSAYDDANAGVWIDPANGLTLGSGTTGLRAGTDGSFYLGATTGSYVQWDGSTFTVSGDITGGTIDIGSESFHVDSEGNMWLGHSNYASAPFKVSKDGNLTATSGTYSGALSAATGTFAGSLSAATGTFSGSLSAATGTFAGSLSAATGTFSGSLSAATGTFSGSLSAATGTFDGNSTSRIKFDTTSESGGSAIRFGKTSDDDAYGYLLYGVLTGGGTNGPTMDGIALKNNGGNSYISIGNSGSYFVDIMSDNILRLTSGSSEASEWVEVSNKLEVNGTLRAKDNCNIGPGLSGFSKSAEQYLQVAGSSDAGIVIASSIGGYLRFGDTGNNSVGGLWYNHFYNILTARANGSDVAHFVSGSFSPHTYNSKDLGRSGYYWSDAFIYNGVTSNSDVNAKKDIENATLGLDFIKSLRPVQYKWKETKGRAGVRTHNGFIAQEVKAVLGASASDTALWCSATDDEETRPNPETGEPEDNPNHGVNAESLRYTELIGPIVKAIQEMEARLSALES